MTTPDQGPGVNVLVAGGGFVRTGKLLNIPEPVSALDRWLAWNTGNPGMSVLTAAAKMHHWDLVVMGVFLDRARDAAEEMAGLQMSSLHPKRTWLVDHGRAPESWPDVLSVAQVLANAARRGQRPRGKRAATHLLLAALHPGLHHVLAEEADVASVGKLLDGRHWVSIVVGRPLHAV